jgi:quercetin dioxygenase-like cupin family protein
MPPRQRTVLTALAAIALAASGCSDDDSSETTTGAASGGEPERQALAQSDAPRGAPGKSLGLARVTIPPGAKLPLHYHEGTQAAYIDEGTLTYTVEEGSVEVSSGSPEEDPESVRTISAGETGTIEAGQWIVEQESVIHRARNEGDEPIVILLATLLREGAPPATPAK